MALGAAQRPIDVQARPIDVIDAHAQGVNTYAGYGTLLNTYEGDAPTPNGHTAEGADAASVDRHEDTVNEDEYNRWFGV